MDGLTEKEGAVVKKDVGVNLWALVMWCYRAVIVGFSGWYTWKALSDLNDWNVVVNFAYLTQVTNAAVLVYYLAWVVKALLNGARRTADYSAEIRGFVVMLSSMVGLLFNTLLGPVDSWHSTVAHVIVPALVVIDWLLFGGNQHRIRRWVPAAWLVPVLVYLGYYVWYSTSGGYAHPYPFLDPAASDFVEWIAILSVSFLTGAYLVYFVGKLISRVRVPRRSTRHYS